MSLGAQGLNIYEMATTAAVQAGAGNLDRTLQEECTEGMWMIYSVSTAGGGNQFPGYSVSLKHVDSDHTCFLLCLLV